MGTDKNVGQVVILAGVFFFCIKDLKTSVPTQLALKHNIRYISDEFSNRMSH